MKYDRHDNNSYTNIWLCGPAEKVFEGKTETANLNYRLHPMKYAPYIGILAAILLITCLFYALGILSGHPSDLQRILFPSE